VRKLEKDKKRAKEEKTFRKRRIKEKFTQGGKDGQE
jgi:hypothetical protein